MKKKIFLTLLFFSAFTAYSQKRFYPKKFNGNTNAIYITNSTSQNDLAFLYTTPADTSKTLFLIENFKPSGVQHLGNDYKFSNLNFCPDNYKTKIGDLVFTFTSEHVLIYFYHAANASSTNEIMN